MDDIHAIQELYKSDILESLKENNIDPQPNAIEDCASEFIDADLYFFKELIKSYDSKHNNKIFVVADFGLWYGRRAGYKEYNSLYEAIFNDILQDTNIIYYSDKRQTLKIDSSHHDGVNHYKLYKLVNNKKYAIKYNELIEG